VADTVPAAQRNGHFTDGICQRCKIHERNDKKPEIKLKTSWRRHHRYPDNDIMRENVKGASRVALFLLHGCDLPGLEQLEEVEDQMGCEAEKK